MVRQADEKVQLPAVSSKADMEKSSILPDAREIPFRDVIGTHPKALSLEVWEGPSIKDFEVKF